ncbi:MAG: chromosomal replication initiator protein DnaA, partial [Sphaerochaetaceae bacterium]|nr:chromosomal replication initiator protein DnaA [Sphaerochaetaceae bacterium]
MADDTLDLQECWNDAAPAIKAAVGDQDYSTWFSRLFFDSQDGNTLVLRTGTRLVLDSAQKNFSDIIISKVSEAAGMKIGLKMILKKSEAKQRQEEQKPAAQEAPSQVLPQKKEGRSRGIEMLNPSYTFESFVPGENSVFAYNACKAISENPGGNYNPCLIYGGVGLGKTHLLQAIGNHIIQNTKLRVQYITSENFVNEFINSVNSRTMQQFKNKYRRVHVLLIDDIQFLENKKETQAELFNTFNDLYDTGRQIVFTCDRPVSELKDISDRLRNRFERGLSIDIQPPEYETRLAILRHKCAEKNIVISDDILGYVAQNVQTNVRDLEACLIKLVAYGDLINKEITMEVA